MRMNMKLTTLAAAALLGSTLIASAQMQPAPGASSSGNVGPGTTTAPMNRNGAMDRDGMSRDGVTTGSGSGSMQRGGMGNNSPSANPSGQGNVGPGTNNTNGPSSGGR